MRSYEWALNQYDVCKRCVNQATDTHEEDYVNIVKDDDHLQAKKRGLRRNQTCSLQNCEEIISVV